MLVHTLLCRKRLGWLSPGCWTVLSSFLCFEEQRQLPAISHSLWVKKSKVWGLWYLQKRCHRRCRDWSIFLLTRVVILWFGSHELLCQLCSIYQQQNPTASVWTTGGWVRLQSWCNLLMAGFAACSSRWASIFMLPRSLYIVNSWCSKVNNSAHCGLSDIQFLATNKLLCLRS